MAARKFDVSALEQEAQTRRALERALRSGVVDITYVKVLTAELRGSGRRDPQSPTALGRREFHKDEDDDLAVFPTANLLAHYEPRDPSNTVSTGRFDDFADLSGNGNTLSIISGGAGRPAQVASADYNGEVVADWAGSVVGMRRATYTQGTISQAFTVVFHVDLTANNQTFFDSAGASNRVFSYSPSGTLTGRFNAGTNIDIASAYTANVPAKTVVVFNGASSAVYIDDPVTAAATADAGANSMAGLSVGCLFTNGIPMRGQLSLFAVFSGAMSEATRTQAMNYITQEFE